MRLGGWLARLLGAVCVGILVLGVPVMVLTAPAVTRTLEYRLVYLPNAGLMKDLGGQAEVLHLTEQVRRYVTDPAAPPLPSAYFDGSASSHLRDVLDVLVRARTLTLAAGVVGALMLAVALRARRLRGIAWSLTAGALGVLVLAVSSALFAAVDFDTFFRVFHGLFFRAGTWTFPADTPLIRLFPEPFWEALGGLWALGVLLGGAACLILARTLRRSTDSHAKVYV